LLNSGTNKLHDPQYLRNMLINLYYALFNETGDIEIGKCLIDDNERQFFRSRVSLLSENTIQMIDKYEVGEYNGQT